MPVVMQKEISGARLVLWRVTETQEQLTSLVTPVDVASAAGFDSPSRRRERLAWRAALRSAGERATVEYTTSGAPYLVGSDNHIGVAHCQGYACVIISPSRCAVDIETAGRDCSRASSRFVREDERSLLAANAASNSNPECVIWCAKEALYKFAGREGLGFIEDIRIVSVEEGGVLDAQVAGERVRVNMLSEHDCVLAVIV